MRAICPELEELEQYAADPRAAPDAVRAHILGCCDCQGRTEELSQNIALFNELGSAAVGLASGLSPAAPLPSEIGEFQIVRELGRGGMGVVYEARQRRPERRVALKVLRADYTASDERRRLFDREIRALARLRHPGITAIFEAGSSVSGPFYAMEFIDGISLSEYARRESPGLRERLALFLKIGAAISYAHQHGVIHRDLKPSNVLIEPGGAPKVLDFGLARITDMDLSGASLAMETGRLVGTLAYMSPEQTRGATDEIDVRSDVYSLGVILFELVTGTLPYDVPRTSVAMAVRSICDSPPRRPSSAGREEDRRALRGDLDTIILRALEKSPEARYQSVAALGEDIERHLTDQPIVARPPTAIYQFRKFARRNRMLVGGVAALFLALALGMATTSWQAYRARQAERRALAEAATSAEISRFLTTLFGSVDPGADGNDVRVVQLLKRAAADLDGSFGDQPRVAIALRSAVGGAYKGLTLYAEAEPLFRSGLELAKREYGDQSRESLQFRYRLAESTAHTGHVDKALAELSATLDAQARELGANDPDTLTTRHFLAVMTAVSGKLDAAEPMLRETLRGRTQSLGAKHERTLETMNTLGTLLRHLGRRDEAATLLRKAHETSLRVHGPDHAQTLVFASHVAMLAETPEELEAVEPTYRDIVERSSRVFGPEHQQTVAFLDSFAQLLELRCKFGEAEERARDLLGRLKRSRGERDSQALDTMARVARLLWMKQQWTEAEEINRQLLAIRREMHGEEDGRTLNAMYELMRPLIARGDLEAAAALGEETLRRMEKVHGESASETALMRTLMSDVLRKQGRLDAADAAAAKALSDLKAAPGTAEILTAWVECSLGMCLMEEGCFAEAEPLLVHGHDRLIAGLGHCHPMCTEMDDAIIGLYRRWEAARMLAGDGSGA